MKKRDVISIGIVVIILILSASIVFAAGAQEYMEQDQQVVDTKEVPDLEDPSGREVSEWGTLASAQGVLRAMRGEWFLLSEGNEYELHMGPLGHDNPNIYTDGASASVTGFFYNNHIAPIRVETEGSVHQFWREDRFPVWSGRGGGRNRVLEPGERR